MDMGGLPFGGVLEGSEYVFSPPFGENGGAKVGHGSGGMSLLRAA